MNENLKAAFEHIAHARQALNHVIEEPGFHSEVWKRAFTQTFNSLDRLKNATPREAATLGPLYIKVTRSMIDQLVEEPENRITLPNLSAIMSYAGYGLEHAQHAFERILLDLHEAEPVTFYTVRMDSSLPYALVLKPDARTPEKYEGYYSAREIHKNMRDIFGEEVVRLKNSDFQAEVELRSVHTSLVVVLLQKNGKLLGLDLSQFLVYGSFNRPMDSLWARVHPQAVYIQCDKGTTGYHTYVAVPARLDDETVARYELAFVSHP